MRYTAFARFLLSSALLFSVSACTKEDGSSEGGESPRDGGPTGAFATECGTLVDGKLNNPPSPNDGFRSAVKVVGSNLLSITLPSGPLLVKLQNIGSASGSTSESAMSALQLLAREEGIFIPAESECTTSVAGGGTGSIGQIFTASGVNYSETLIKRGLASLSTDPCGGDKLSSCYRALQEDAKEKFAGEIGRLLWKPVADSDGRLAVHTKPYGTTVKVNGETGVNKGPGNGYGSLARFNKPGCGYGNSVQVQVFNASGAAYTFNGSTTITIPTGCSRTCVEGSSLAQCSK